MEPKKWSNDINTNNVSNFNASDDDSSEWNSSSAFVDGDFTAIPLNDGSMVVTHEQTPFYFHVKRNSIRTTSKTPATITATLHEGKFTGWFVTEETARHDWDMTWPADTPQGEVTDDIIAAFHRYLWEFPCTFQAVGTRRKKGKSEIMRGQILSTYNGYVTVFRVEDEKDVRNVKDTKSKNTKSEKDEKSEIRHTLLGVFDAGELRSAWMRFRAEQVNVAAIGRELGENYTLSASEIGGMPVIRASRRDMPGTTLTLWWHPLMLSVGRVTMETALPEDDTMPAKTGELGKDGHFGSFTVPEMAPHAGAPRQLTLKSGTSPASVVCLRATDVPRKTAAIIDCFFALMAWRRCESVEITVAGRNGAATLTPDEFLSRAVRGDRSLRTILTLKARANDPCVALHGNADRWRVRIRMRNLYTVLRAVGPSAAGLRS